MQNQSQVIEEIRAESRIIVREWGFMGGSFAGTDLSPSAVHALIEIEQHNALSARELAERLRLEKSSVSRMLRKLVESGDIKEQSIDDDGRVKSLTLTAAGKRRLAKIHKFAQTQVEDALARLKPGQELTVLEGLRLYNRALRNDPNPNSSSPIIIKDTYQPGLIARITEMHANYYARESGFGQVFESKVAEGLAQFCYRLDNPMNGIWTAVQDGKILGSVAIDGEDLGQNIAHLRWFIVDDNLRGTGIGRKLLKAALDFVDKQNFSETHLWTFKGLSAARHLYETLGFECVEEWIGTQWGKEVTEQRFARKLLR